MTAKQDLTKTLTSAVVSWLSKDFSRMVVTELTDRSWFGHNRFDVVAITPNGSTVDIVEVKVSRQDFLRGRNKFPDYQKYCNRFLVAAPAGLISPEELPKGIGLLEFYRTALRCKKWPHTQPLSPDMYLLMINRVVQKLVVEGSRWSQKHHWEQKGLKWRFREWLNTRESECRRKESRFRDN